MKSKRILRASLIVLLPVFAVMWSACSPEEFVPYVQDPPQVPQVVTVTGTVPPAMVGEMMSRSTGASIDTVAAFPIVAHDFDSIFGSGEYWEVPDSGEFEITLDPETNYILVLMNRATTEKRNMVVGFASVTTGAETLVCLPTAYALDDFDLGMLDYDPETSELVSDASLAVSLDGDTVASWARFDDVLKSLANYAINYDEDLQTYYRFIVSFDWSLSDHPVNRAIEPHEYGFDGFSFGIWTNALTAADYADFAAATRTLAIFPPAPITGANGLEYNESVPVSNLRHPDGGWLNEVDHLTFSDEDIGIDSPELRGEFLVAAAMQFPDADMIEGYWALCHGTDLIRSNLEELAVFELAPNSPFDDEGNPRVFIPSIAVWVENEYEIVDITVDWFQYDRELATFEPVSDAVVADQTRHVSLCLTDWNDAGWQDGRVDSLYDPTTQTYASLGETWYLGSYPDEYDHEAEYIGLTYDVFGTIYWFSLRP